VGQLFLPHHDAALFGFLTDYPTLEAAVAAIQAVGRKPLHHRNLQTTHPPTHRKTRATPAMRKLLGLLVIIVLIVVVVNAAKGHATYGGTNPASPPGPYGAGTKTHPAINDVAITSCGVDPTLGFPQPSVAVTNHSSGTSDYTYQVDFMHGTTVISQGYGTEENIAPGQSATDQIPGDNQASSVTCQLVDVERTAS
jgi:hypothetical protein